MLEPHLHPWHRTIRPFGAYALHGIAFQGNYLLALDTVRGYLLRVDPKTDDTRILNTCQVDAFIGASGLSIWENTLWFAREGTVYCCDLNNLIPRPFVEMSYWVDGVAVQGKTIYVASQREGYISIFNLDSRRLITRLRMPGVGVANLTIRGEELWVCDRTEQTVYCLDRATGEQQFCLLTPFENPSGLAFYIHPQTGDSLLYVAYATEEAYVRDDPNSDPPHVLTFRDRTFVHPLHYYHNPDQYYALSNGYLVEMSYFEELLPLEEMQNVELRNLEWRIALPAETHRQKVLKVEPIGLPFTEEVQNGQRVAVFKFDSLKYHERHLFGWRATLELRGIKYLFQPGNVEKLPPLPAQYQTTYLVDDDDLAMHTPVIREAARVAIGTETNLLRKMLSIRNYVYDRLSYRIKPHIDTPDIALQRGTGSCGEYVGVLLALTRLNGIACRTVGRYKCPQKPDLRHIPLEPDFNHVWLEFYIPGYGWLPMESNPDDIMEQGPYPTRFFMGLPWYHAEIGKGIPFEKIQAENKPEELSIGDIALNHIRFTILDELPPPTNH